MELIQQLHDLTLCVHTGYEKTHTQNSLSLLFKEMIILRNSFKTDCINDEFCPSICIRYMSFFFLVGSQIVSISYH